jgi:hypothetical protein
VVDGVAIAGTRAPYAAARSHHSFRIGPGGASMGS